MQRLVALEDAAGLELGLQVRKPGQALREMQRHAVDIPCPQSDDEIARLEHCIHGGTQAPQGGLVVDAGLPAGADRFGHRLAGDARHGGFASGVDFGDEDFGGVVKSGGEFAEECLRPGIAVRLKQGEDALPAAVLGGGERRLDLGGMVRVVIDDHVLAGVVFHFEPAGGTPKFREGADDLGPADAAFRGQGDDTKGVADILCARNIERHFAEQRPLAQDGKPGGKIIEPDIERAVIGELGEPVADGLIAM